MVSGYYSKFFTEEELRLGITELEMRLKFHAVRMLLKKLNVLNYKGTLRR